MTAEEYAAQVERLAAGLEEARRVNRELSWANEKLCDEIAFLKDPEYRKRERLPPLSLSAE